MGSVPRRIGRISIVVYKDLVEKDQMTATEFGYHQEMDDIAIMLERCGDHGLQIEVIWSTLLYLIGDVTPEKRLETLRMATQVGLGEWDC